MLLLPIPLFAGYSKYGRYYLETEDNPFSSPGEIIGGIIIIVCCYWLLRGLLSIPDYLKREQTTTTKGASERIKGKSYYCLEVEELIRQYDKAPTIELAQTISKLYSWDGNDFEARLWKSKVEDIKLENLIQNLIREYQQSPSSSKASDIANYYRKKYTYSYRSMNYSEESTIERWEEQAKEMSIKETINSQKRQFDKNPSSKLATEIMDNYRQLSDYQNINIWMAKVKVEKEKEEKKEREKKRKEMEDKIEKLKIIFEDNPDSDIAPELFHLYLETRNLKGILYFYKTREQHSLPPLIEDIGNVIPPYNSLPYSLKEKLKREKNKDVEREAEIFRDLKELASKELYYKNHIQVMTHLALCYACGIGTEKDIQKAMQIIDELRDYKLLQLNNDKVDYCKMPYYPRLNTSAKTVIGLQSMFNFNNYIKPL